MGEVGIAEGGLEFRKRVKRTIQKNKPGSGCGNSRLAAPFRQLTDQGFPECAGNLAACPQPQVGVKTDMGIFQLRRIRKNIQPQVSIAVRIAPGLSECQIQRLLIQPARQFRRRQTYRHCGHPRDCPRRQR